MFLQYRRRECRKLSRYLTFRLRSRCIVGERGSPRIERTPSARVPVGAAAGKGLSLTQKSYELLVDYVLEEYLAAVLRMEQRAKGRDCLSQHRPTLKWWPKKQGF